MILEWKVRNYDSESKKKICKSSPSLKKDLFTILSTRSYNRNEIEYKNYCKMPEKLKQYFPFIWYENWDIYSDTVLNYDNNISMNLYDYKWYISEDFWTELRQIINIMIKNNYYLYDLNAKNILIQYSSQEKQIPKLIDCKRLWNKVYPLQINLLLKSQRIKKIYRQYDKLRNIEY